MGSAAQPRGLKRRHGDVSLPVRQSRTPPPGSPRPSRYGRWRAATLALVYVLFAVHFVQWKITGSTLTPLELNEVMYTLELGVITAGFLFMAAAMVSTVIFGRFFCSWGCHILALEDLCAWLLEKIHIRPKPVRSRALLLVAPGAMFYMFIWPQLSRLLRGDPLPHIRILTDQEGWASFITTQFWRNLPGPGITILTLGVAGFAIVYFIGSRSFCAYACPYGALFSLADRVAPGRIVETGVCTQCGHCTAVCQSHVRVHEEIGKFGMIVDANCLKDLDCVSVCPEQALGYAFTRPSLGRSFTSTGRRRLRYDFTFAEDVLMVGVFLLTLAVFRGLYGLVPFLMTLGLGGIFAYLAVLSLRLVWRPNVRLNNFQLKIKGRLTGRGRSFVAFSMALGALTADSAVVRYYELTGDRDYKTIQAIQNETGADPTEAMVSAAVHHLRSAQWWGVVRSPDLDTKLASLYPFTDTPARAEPHLRRIVLRNPDDLESRLRLAYLLAGKGRYDEASSHLDAIVSAAPSTIDADHLTTLHAAAFELFGQMAVAVGDRQAALGQYNAALEDQPDRVSAHMALSELLADAGDLDKAVGHLRAALTSDPNLAPAHYNLATILASRGLDDEAIEHFRSAVRLDQGDPEAFNSLGFLLARRGDLDEAVESFQRAIALAPNNARSHFNLAMALKQLGQDAKAQEQLKEALRLDPRYGSVIKRAEPGAGAPRP